MSSSSIRKTHLTVAARAFVAVAGLIIVGTGVCHAECGDVTGDGSVTTQDALRTLRKAVGQGVEMSCDAIDPAANDLAYTNLILCNGSDPHATLTWSEHPSLKWKTNVSMQFPWSSSDFKEVDDLYMQGSLTATFGACGSVTLDLDAKQIAFYLPNHAGTSVDTLYDASRQAVALILDVRPVSTAPALTYGDNAGPLIMGTVHAPAGLSAAIDP